MAFELVSGGQKRPARLEVTTVSPRSPASPVVRCLYPSSVLGRGRSDRHTNLVSRHVHPGFVDSAALLDLSHPLAPASPPSSTPRGLGRAQGEEGWQEQGVEAGSRVHL
jgi:hypothetical protein